MSDTDDKDSKTEAPSDKKVRDALDKGNIPFSREAPLFASILGSPRTKLELCAGVLAERRCRPSDAILIGDGAMDFRVCQELDIHFVYLSEFSEWAGADAALSGAPGVSVASRWDDLLALLLPR